MEEKTNFVDNKWEWDADAAALQQTRKTAVTHEKMEPKPAAQWEGKQRIFLRLFQKQYCAYRQ